MDKYAALLTVIDGLTTANLADGCRMLALSPRCAPPALRPLTIRMRCAGWARTVCCDGSVETLRAAIGRSNPGDILVVDNDARADEACLGDQIVLEAMSAGMRGAIVSGMHRDTVDLLEIGFPVFSYGSHPCRPHRTTSVAVSNDTSTRIGIVPVTTSDFVVADSDGVLFLASEHLEDIVSMAVGIRSAEGRSAKALRDAASRRCEP